jgi:hypothetical protein
MKAGTGENGPAALEVNPTLIGEAQRAAIAIEETNSKPLLGARHVFADHCSR